VRQNWSDILTHGCKWDRDRDETETLGWWDRDVQKTPRDRLETETTTLFWRISVV